MSESSSCAPRLACLRPPALCVCSAPGVPEAACSVRVLVVEQNGKYALAAEDLEKAAELEQIAYGYSSGFVRVALGNAQGAQGDWEAALENFELAQEDPYPGLKELGMYNHALAQFELGRSTEAVAEANELLAISDEFTDLRGALVGFLWAQGEEDAAKGLAEQTGGMSVLRDLTVTQQAGKTWPPRTIAAVTAFINAERTGRALDYYDKPVEYTF
ncbi:hypothetical protein CYMTET_50397 [Cymbomonas tetramitiformis]|uniref:Tetratricopeptide repeat protein n=1 Tax=Cymbomonas tetramitiformis TaxID=36881 RepID=A0AAE0ETI7_9CHLO|nr:hypothetical protein CYMTET_50397 [Cymbomonas tetramitiformis]